MEFLNKLDVNNSKVTEVATPTLGTDAANKDYVDTKLALKAPLASPTFTGTVTAPTFSGALTGSLTGNADTATSATTATGIKGSDTRYNNKAPSSYIGLGADMYLAPTYSRSEFKSISTMGLGSYLTGSYCYVMTHVPWSDISGGKPVQVAYGDGIPCYRVAVDSSAWGAWTPINNGGNADKLDGQQGSYYAPIASPALTGVPTAPTAPLGTNSTQVATTAFVNAEIANDAAPIAHVGATGAAHGLATGAVNGFMSSSDYNKLSGIAASANNYVHPTGDGNLHVPASGTSNTGKVLTATAVAGVYTWARAGAGSTTLADLGITATATEINYTDGVTGSIQSSLDSKIGIYTGTEAPVDTKCLWVDTDSEVNTGITIVPVTLSAASWSSGNYTISNASITSGSVITITPSSTITVAQYDAIAGAKIIENSISAGQVILKALGTVPTIDCPVVLIIEG